uniref:Lactamase_B domain-containing protein n=1 Tax=Soboliphyme baturini TaxID=241478 RepID=A0A183I983_9BILA
LKRSRDKRSTITKLFLGNTHVHADHVTGTGEIQKLVPDCKTFLSARSNGKCDIKLHDKDKLKIGKLEIEALCTPGHTDGCMTFVCHPLRLALTGDTLLIRGCGRTDFQQGDPHLLYRSVHNQILSLPKDFLLFPGHDYKGLSVSSVEEEIKLNPRLTLPEEKFVKLMNELNLPMPKQINKAVPANMVNGQVELMTEEIKKLVMETAKIH